MLADLFRRWEVALSRRDRNRRIRPFEWGTEFVQNGAPIHDPKVYLLTYARQALERSDEYHSYRPVSDYRLQGPHLTFSSPVQTIYPSNNTVHGWYFPTQSRGRAVLVLPQWNSNSQGHMRLARMLNRFGLSSLRLSMPYHDLRMPEGGELIERYFAEDEHDEARWLVQEVHRLHDEGSRWGDVAVFYRTNAQSRVVEEELVRADYMLSPNLGRTLQSVRQAVIDCRATLDWLVSQGYTKLAVLGTSLGSCIGFITMAHDPRLKISVQNHVSPYFADVVWTGISTRHVRAGIEGHISLEELREIWLPISPRAYLPKIVDTGKMSLLIHARYDHSFLPELSRLVLEDYRRLGLPHEAIELRCGHYSSGKFPFNILLGYRMCEYLRRNV